MGNPKIDNIVCVAWGSLVWRPENLPVRTEWFDDGPQLPVEFARQSRGSLISLVLCPGRPTVSTCWAVLDVPDMRVAQRALGQREWSEALRHPQWMADNIGCWERDRGGRGAESTGIGEWASQHGFAGVVWTGLPCKFRGQNGTMPTEDEVIEPLRSLSGVELTCPAIFGPVES